MKPHGQINGVNPSTKNPAVNFTVGVNKTNPAKNSEIGISTNMTAHKGGLQHNSTQISYTKRF